MAVAVDLVGLRAGLETAQVAWRELHDGELATYAVDGVAPLAICWPSSYAEAASALAVADRLGLAVSPRGSGTKTALGNRPRAVDLVVSTERLNEIVEYAPANLTTTVQAGIRLADLQRHLAPHGQHVPLDPPFAAAATLGGIIASNSSGPRRLGFGTARDLVIGTRVATVSGLVARSGGRVVKNVAGYDLNKLYIGSVGTLALVVEIGLKVAPRPTVQTTVLGRFDRLDQIASATRALLRSPLMPIAIELLNANAVADLGISHLPDVGSGYLLAALGSAPGPAVERQRTAFGRLFVDAGASQVADVASDLCNELWTAVAESPYQNTAGNGILLRLAVPPGRIADGIGEVERFGAEIQVPLSVSAHAGSGIILVSLSAIRLAGAGSLEKLVPSLATIRMSCRALGGSLVVERCPIGLKAHVDVWGDVGTSLPIMRRLKDALDPRGTLNPGRFVGGI